MNKLASQLENENGKRIPEDAASWIAAPSNTVFKVLARLAYAILRMQFEYATEEDIENLFEKKPEPQPQPEPDKTPFIYGNLYLGSSEDKPEDGAGLKSAIMAAIQNNTCHDYVSDPNAKTHNSAHDNRYGFEVTDDFAVPFALVPTSRWSKAVICGGSNAGDDEVAEHGLEPYIAGDSVTIDGKDYKMFAYAVEAYDAVEAFWGLY